LENNYWDKSAGGYDKHTEKQQKMYDKLIMLMKSELSESDITLDIGTGTGIIPILLSNCCKEFHGVDKSAAMIDIAKNKIRNSKINNVSFSVQDCYDLQLENKKYDVIIISNLLHIVEYPEKVLEEAFKALKDDGKLIVATYLHGYSLKTKIISFILKMMDHPVYTRFDRNILYNLIQKSGFNPIKQELIPNVIPASFLVSKKGS